MIPHLSDCRRPSCRRFRQTAKGDKFSYSAVHLAPASLGISASAYRSISHIPAFPCSKKGPFSGLLGTQNRLKSQMHFAVSGWFCSVRKSLSVQVRSFWGPGVPDVSERSLNLCWPKARHASPAPMNRNASVASFTTCDATT